MSSMNMKETFEVQSKHGAFYTGGNVQWSTDGQYIFCQNHGTVSVVSVNKGIAVSRIGESKYDEAEDVINTFTPSNDNLHIFTHHRSGLFKFWNWKENKLLKLWKSIHKGPVIHLACCDGKSLMISGGSDGAVKLWNLQHYSCIHNLKGIQGVVSVLAFHPNEKRNLVFAAGDDLNIHGWNIKSGQEEISLSGHLSKVTSLNFYENGNYLISSGRDRVLILWDVFAASPLRVLPVYEEIESVFIVPEDVPLCFNTEGNSAIYAAAAGEKGIVQIWEMKTGRKMYEQKNSIVHKAIREDGTVLVTHLLYDKCSNNFAIVTADHNIIIHSLETFECTKQLVGYSDEILDIAYLGANENHIVVATNSCNINLYNLSTMSCELLCGHTDIVLSLATTAANPYLLVSSAKDNSVRIWTMNKETEKVCCIAAAVRHTDSVGSVALSQTSCAFFASVSQDSCLKLWNLPKSLEDPNEVQSSINAVHTTLAHQKDINCVTISPNDKLIATGSQDKTAKLWSADELQLLGAFRGHRRGVWCVRFSPIDQVLLTTSADCTIKLWSLIELNCLKTLEGHDSSVLKAEFLTRGMQIVTAGGDGLLKLWSIKTSECLCTMEEHEHRVWSLAVSKEEKNIISGGGDSLLIIWRDVTEEKKKKVAEELKQLAVEEQLLSNLLKANKLNAALNLSLKLGKHLQVLKIIENILKEDNDKLKETVQGLKPFRKEELMKCAILWNTNSKNCQAAQVVINALMSDMQSKEFQTNLPSTLESTIPYTERHYLRITKLLQNLHFFTYTLNRMKPHVTSIGIN